MAWIRTAIRYGNPLFRTQFGSLLSRNHYSENRALLSSIYYPRGEQTIAKTYHSRRSNDDTTLHKYNRWYRPAAKRKRTLFYVPGSSERMIQKAWKISPDIIVLDLEDSVHSTEKPRARELIVKSLRENPKHSAAEIAVRINTTAKGPVEEDLRALIPVSDAIDAIVLPKFTLQHFRNLADYIGTSWLRGNNFPYNIYGLIEKPISLETLFDDMETHLYYDTTSSRIAGFIFGAEDYARFTGITRSETLDEMTYARQRLVSISKAFNLQCFDLVSTNFRDVEALRAECKQGRAYGFTGKQAIHPNQIDIIHEEFSPSQEEVARAVRLLTEFVKESQEGRRGSWEFEGQMVDKPVISLARRILYLEKDFGMSLGVVEPLIEQVEKTIAEGKENDALDDDEEYGPP